MNSRELDYNDYHFAIGDKRKEMRRDTLWCLCTCTVLVVDLPLFSPMLIIA
jgi:hypothetical protein